jgi:small subunit ribosomal protein S16
MLRIRLSRTGRKNLANYRIVVANQHDKRNGRSLDIIGFYDPKTKPSKIEIKKELALNWLKQGAQPTDTVRALFVKEGVMPKKRKLKKYNQAPGKKAQARASKKAEAAPPKA